ncbi:MAG: hypothetical protein ACON5F_06450 [Jejuia sp.]
MKTILKTTIIIALLNFNLLICQEKNIETHSVQIDNLISYIVENYEKDGEDLYNLTFLIQTSNVGYSLEDKVVLKQAFSLLSKRMGEDNTISILGYSALNGAALEQKSVKEIKKILHVINDIKSNIKEFHEDGITFAYEYANENFDDEAINRVVMIRLPNSSNVVNEVSISKQAKKKNNAIVLTAIALLPEIISVLKD